MSVLFVYISFCFYSIFALPFQFSNSIVNYDFSTCSRATGLCTCMWVGNMVARIDIFMCIFIFPPKLSSTYIPCLPSTKMRNEIKLSGTSQSSFYLSPN